jgi:SSS family solute:Na+ symporter
MFPVLVTPFSHGVDPEGGFKYTRALFGLAGSGLIALLVTLFTKGKRESELEGLVVGTLWKAKEIYKGGEPNEAEGAKVTCLLRETGGSEEVDGPGEISVSREMADSLRAEVGDIVYLSDGRWWLGGLRSVHAKLSAIRNDGDTTVHVSSSLRAEGSLQIERRHTIEKII